VSSSGSPNSTVGGRGRKQTAKNNRTEENLTTRKAPAHDLKKSARKQHLPGKESQKKNFMGMETRGHPQTQLFRTLGKKGKGESAAEKPWTLNKRGVQKVGGEGILKCYQSKVGLNKNLKKVSKQMKCLRGAARLSNEVTKRTSKPGVSTHH